MKGVAFDAEEIAVMSITCVRKNGSLHSQAVFKHPAMVVVSLRDGHWDLFYDPKERSRATLARSLRSMAAGPLTVRHTEKGHRSGSAHPADDIRPVARPPRASVEQLLELAAIAGGRPAALGERLHLLAGRLELELRAHRDRERATAEVARLEEQLAEAKAKLRHPAGKRRHSRSAARCERCGREFASGQSLGGHSRRCPGAAS